MDIFGEQWADHARRLKDNWVESVSEDATVIICGDISGALGLRKPPLILSG